MMILVPSVLVRPLAICPIAMPVVRLHAAPPIHCSPSIIISIIIMINVSIVIMIIISNLISVLLSALLPLLDFCI